jgi:hypothetical protein
MLVAIMYSMGIRSVHTITTNHTHTMSTATLVEDDLRGVMVLRMASFYNSTIRLRTSLPRQSHPNRLHDESDSTRASSIMECETRAVLVFTRSETIYASNGILSNIVSISNTDVRTQPVYETQKTHMNTRTTYVRTREPRGGGGWHMYVV